MVFEHEGCADAPVVSEYTPVFQFKQPVENFLVVAGLMKGKFETIELARDWSKGCPEFKIFKRTESGKGWVKVEQFGFTPTPSTFSKPLLW